MLPEDPAQKPFTLPTLTKLNPEYESISSVHVAKTDVIIEEVSDAPKA